MSVQNWVISPVMGFLRAISIKTASDKTLSLVMCSAALECPFEPPSYLTVATAHPRGCRWATGCSKREKAGAKLPPWLRIGTTCRPSSHLLYWGGRTDVAHPAAGELLGWMGLERSMEGMFGWNCWEQWSYNHPVGVWQHIKMVW